MTYKAKKVKDVKAGDTLTVTADNGKPVDFKVKEVIEYATIDIPVTELRTDKGIFESIEDDSVIIKNTQKGT